MSDHHRMRNHEVKTWAGVLILLFVAAYLAAGVVWTAERVKGQISGNAQGLVRSVKKIADTITHVFVEPEPLPPPPPPPSWDSIKKKGCVADGILNGGSSDAKRAIELINRSECEYLHRAVETWLEAPDFDDIKKNMKKITRKKMVYGMFIAEAIDTKADLYYPVEERYFDFSKMCRPGTKNDWGEHTCKPSLAKSEYRKYVRYISEQAMNLGVQSFLFGQVHYQDDLSDSEMPLVIQDMRDYAKFRGIEILIGAQTNDIDDEDYLRQFDYIEGGVGLSPAGGVESGPCFSRWDNWCWALLWHDRYKSKANNVLLHLDWSGRQGDDMSTFALMDRSTRARTLKNLHSYFTGQDVGFMMPMLAVLPKDNGGCHGKSRKFYSADNKFSCKDEDVINEILE